MALINPVITPKRAGRPKGAINKDRRFLVASAKYAGKTPLALMIECMQAAFTDGDQRAGFFYAKEIAPYVHPKLTAIQVQSVGHHRTIDQFTEAELYALASGDGDSEAQLSAQGTAGVYDVHESQLSTSGPSSDNLQ